MFREIVVWLIASLMRECSEKPERTPGRGANAWPMKKEGTPDL
jgi:hypothetical protein